MRVLKMAVPAALLLVLSTTGTPWQLAFSTGVQTSLPTQQVQQPGSTGPTHGGSSYVCSQRGLGSGLSVSVGSNGNLHISFSGRTVGVGPQAILSAWSAYSRCVTTSPTLSQVICSTIHDARHNLQTCYVDLKIKPVAWQHTSPSTPPTTTTIAGATASCLAQLQQPTITVAHPSIASMSYYPAHTWLLNLPVEYAFKNAPAPAPQLTGQTSASCSATPLSRSYTIPHQPGQKRSYTVVTNDATGSVRLQISNFATTSVTPGPASVTMALADNPTQTLASEPSCPAHSTLVAPAQLPNYQGNLPEYASYFKAHQICTITPSGLGWEQAAVGHQPIIFNLGQEWIFHTSYRVTGTITTDYSGSTVAYYPSGAVRTISTYNQPSTTPYSGAQHNVTLPVLASEYHSPPIAVDFVTGVECSFIRGTVTCPHTGSAG